jgi:hypothetical protein
MAHIENKYFSRSRLTLITGQAHYALLYYQVGKRRSGFIRYNFIIDKTDDLFQQNKRCYF